MSKYDLINKKWDSIDSVTHDDLHLIVGKNVEITTSSDGTITFGKELSEAEKLAVESLITGKRVT